MIRLQTTNETTQALKNQARAKHYDSASYKPNMDTFIAGIEQRHLPSKYPIVNPGMARDRRQKHHGQMQLQDMKGEWGIKTCK